MMHTSYQSLKSKNKNYWSVDGHSGIHGKTVEHLFKTNCLPFIFLLAIKNEAFEFAHSVILHEF